MYKKFYLITALMTGVVFSCFSQAVTNYAFANTTTTFTALALPTNPALSGGNVDDGFFNNIPIGFDFWYMGTRHTTISASTNGWFTFGTNIVNSSLINSLTNGSALRPVIAPLWDDVDIQDPNNVGYEITGTAPNRVFTIEYLNTKWRYTATDTTISFQAKLYESSGKVEFIYRPEVGTPVTPSASIGITASGTGSGNFLSVNNLGTSASSVTEEANVTAKPILGKTYAFTPLVPIGPGSLTFSGVVTTSMTLNWSDLSLNERGFVIYKSTDGVNYSFISQTAAGATSSDQSGLTEGTMYYWKVYAISEGGFSAALVGNQLTPLDAWYNSSWLYRKVITIDYTKVGAGTHTNFPLLISRIDTDLQTKAQIDADDIFFTSSDGTTKLAHEIESYTSATGTIVAWVSIPSLSSTVNTVIYMYYGNATALSQQNRIGTWDANYKGVWHLNSAFTDATSNNNNGTNTGTIAATGKISGGSGFVRSNGADYITVLGKMGSPTSFTLGAWANVTTADVFAADIISIADNSVLRYDVTSSKTNGVAYDGTLWPTTSSLTNYASGWHYVVYTFDDAGNVQRIYIDGLPNGAATSFTASPTYPGGTNTFIGTHGNGNVNMDFDGTIDEVRVSNSVRSAGWIFTEYNNQNPVLPFYSVGGEAKTYYSRATGNWNNAATWSNTGHGGTASSTTPGIVIGDNVIVGNNNSVTLNVNVTNKTIIGVNSTGTLNMGTNTIGGAGSFTINSGATLGIGTGLGITVAGALGNVQVTGPRTFSTGANYIYNSTLAQVTGNGLPATVNSLTINNNLGVTLSASVITNAGLSITAGTLNANNLNLTVGGNWINNGTFTPGLGRVTFNGAGTHTVTGSATTAFNTITVNKGTDYTSNILDVQSVITMTAGGLTLVNGTFKLSSNSTITPFIVDLGTAPFRIPATTGLWVNGGVVSTQEGVSSAGLVRVSAGILNIGDGVEERFLAGNGSVINIEGGALNVAARLTRITAGNVISFTMSGGTMTMPTVGSTHGTYAPFTFDEPASSFTMSGGTIIIAKSGGANLGYHNLAATTNVTGGTIQIGSTSTPAANTININSSAPIQNLTVNGTNSPAVVLVNPLTVYSNVAVSGGSLNISTYTLKIGGGITSSGNFNAGNGTIEMNGTSAQAIPVNAFTGNNIKNLTINNIAGVTIGGLLYLTDALTISSGNLASNGFLTLKSSATGTARVAPLPPTSSVTGNVTIERYIPARRAWRLLSAPLSVTGAPTINAAWQEGVTSGNPFPGYGTHIVGGTAGNGYDLGLNSNPSLKIYNNSTNSFIGLPVIPGTNAAITSYPGYFLFVRGNRSTNLSQGANAAITPTILRMKGLIKTGDIPVAVNALNMTLVGNPYPSPIDFRLLVKTNVSDKLYIWDATLAGSSGVGGYITMVWNGTTGVYDGAPLGSQLNRFIPSGSAFFVESLDRISPGIITVKEIHKSTSGNELVFRPVSIGEKQRVNLFAVNTDGSAYLTDGVLTTYDDNNSNLVDNNDATKLWNVAENISIGRHGKMLSIERRQTIDGDDTTFLNLYTLKQQTYKLQITTEAMENSGLYAVVKDNYSASINNTPVNMGGVTDVIFTVNSDAASYAPNRFSIVFGKPVVLPVKITSLTALRQQKDIVVSWKTENELNIKEYEVQTSATGFNFVKSATFTSKSNNGGGANYTWPDVNATEGVHYYRIKSTEFGGKENYSLIVKVTMDKGSGGITVYPNPVTGGVIPIQLNNMAAGKYKFRLLNRLGQVLFVKEIKHMGGNASEKITLKKEYAKGVYSLKITNPDNTTTIISVVNE